MGLRDLKQKVDTGDFNNGERSCSRNTPEHQSWSPLTAILLYDWLNHSVCPLHLHIKCFESEAWWGWFFSICNNCPVDILCDGHLNDVAGFNHPYYIWFLQASPTVEGKTKVSKSKTNSQTGPYSILILMQRGLISNLIILLWRTWIAPC